MEHLSQWLPTISTAAVVIGIAFVADASIKRHEGVIGDLVRRVTMLEQKVAVLEATKKG